MSLGPTEVVLFSLFLIPFGLIFPIWGVVDATSRSDAAWARAEQNKTLWIVLQAVGMLVCFGWILALVYLTVVRPKVRAAESGIVPA